MLAERNNQVIILNSDLVYDQIERFLIKKEQKSVGTRKSYETDIRIFFQFIKNKDVKYLTRDDVNLTIDDFEDFINYHQKNEIYSNKTINGKVSAVKSLLKYLKVKKLIDDDLSYFSEITTLPEKRNSYGILTLDEVLKWAELALTEKHKPKEKRLLILLALDTCIRKEAILKLKWSDFEVKENHVIVKGIDKGNKEFRHDISEKFYNELLDIKSDSDLVFNGISNSMIHDMIKRFKQQTNIESNRNIVFHSIRKAGGTFRYKASGGDIVSVQRALGHSDSKVTSLYLGETTSNSLGAISSISDIDSELYKKVEHEILIKVIESLSETERYLLNKKIEKMV
ncbi:site-specific integrase [Niallia sp. FSL W8-0951]|uniref:tyrosine-type recombinase/integrase n=1 Tax=unclassified Niallia TaxID=2837522 RepID=UPI0030FC717C